MTKIILEREKYDTHKKGEWYTFQKIPEGYLSRAELSDF